MGTPKALGRGEVVTLGGPTRHATVVTIDSAVLAAPEAVVATLHHHWLTRTPLSVVLSVDPGQWRQPRSEPAEPYRLAPDFTPWWDRLHFLLWANNVDARGGEPIWWWSRKAERLGASPGGKAGDVVLPDGTAVYIDGGPRDPALAARHPLVHAESVDLGRLTRMPGVLPVPSELAPDQRAAVTHGSGPARILAPAGSGKTRVLAERLRHLVTGCGYEPAGLLALAYNKRAQAQLEERTEGLGVRIQTLNSLGLEILREARPGVSVISERDLRGLLESVLPELSWRSNTDPLAPYLEALAAVRLGLRSPQTVEAESETVTGLAEAFPLFRAALADRGVVDFDEQLYAAVEALLADGELRRRWQRRCRHLLVDEFQDLRPLHLLLIRLLGCPELDVFGVGDDDQVIYGYDGASPRFLTEFSHYFPGATDHPLTVNYRSPAAVISATTRLLSHNRLRLDKKVRPGAHAVGGKQALSLQRGRGSAAATAIRDTVKAWLKEGAAPRDIAILARVNSSLLVPQVVLTEASVPVATAVDQELLGRTGTRAALAYLRLATAGDSMASADIAEILRRPSRGLPPWFGERIHRRRQWSLRALAQQEMPEKEGAKLEHLVEDLALLQRLAATDTARVLAAVRLEVGLGGAMAKLSRGAGADRSSHLDDLQALERIAPLAPDAGSFEPWLRGLLARPGDARGVTLSTVHRVKGLEWPRILVIDASEGMMPHRLSEDLEEERRIFHVALTRAREAVVVHVDSERPSRFVAELDAAATVGGVATSPTPAVAIAPVVGDILEVTGGIVGEVVRTSSSGVTLSLGRGTNLMVKRGERVTLGGRSGPLGVAGSAPRAPRSQAESSVEEQALRQWRLERARHDGVPPYMVLHDVTLIAIAELNPRTAVALGRVAGIGPAKLERYGEEILATLAAR